MFPGRRVLRTGIRDAGKQSASTAASGSPSSRPGVSPGWLSAPCSSLPGSAGSTTRAGGKALASPRPPPVPKARVENSSRPPKSRLREAARAVFPDTLRLSLALLLLWAEGQRKPAPALPLQRWHDERPRNSPQGTLGSSPSSTPVSRPSRASHPRRYNEPRSSSPP